MWCGQGVWIWQERAESINLSELREVRTMLLGGLKEPMVPNGVKELMVIADNQSVVHIENSFLSASIPMMSALRRLKMVLDDIGIRNWAERLPSDVNKFADGLSRIFPRGDLLMRRQIRNLVVDGLKDSWDAFQFRHIFENQPYLCTEMYPEFNRDWSKEVLMLICFQVDLIGAVVKITME